MHSTDHQTVRNAAKQLESVLASHLRELGRPEASVMLMGVPGPGVAAAVAASAQERKVAVHLVESGNPLPEWIGQLGSDIGQQLCIYRALPWNLKLDPVELENRLQAAPCRTARDWNAMLQAMDEQARSTPLFPDESMDVVVMELLLNRIPPADADQALREAFRVLQRHGKLLMTVVLADEAVTGLAPKSLDECDGINFPVEMDLLRALERCGYHAIHILNTDRDVVGDHGRAELGVFVIEARKGKQGPCLEQGHAVVFRGPWSEVYDDDGHRYVRGERTAVCAKTYALLMSEPYRTMFIGLPAHNAPSLEAATAFDCATPRIRSPKVTKGMLEMTCDSDAGSGCC